MSMVATRQTNRTKKDTKNFKQRQKLKKKNTNTRLSEYLKTLELTEVSARDAVTCKTHQT